MTDSGEIDEPAEAPRRRSVHSRLLALLAALLLAATAVVAFGAGSASAQTQNDNGIADQQLADDAATDDADEDNSEGACDLDGARRRGGLGRFGRGGTWFGMGDTLTELLGIDAETLRTKLKDGSTLADIAAEQGIAVSDVIDALVTAVTDKAAEHDREIDVDAVTERITARVNGEKPERPEGGFGEGRRHGSKRFGGNGLGGFGSHGHGSNAGAWSTST